MKPLSIILIFMVLSIFSFGQNREVVTARGFYNIAMAVDSLPGNQWVFATISSKAEGAIYEDTLTLWVCDSMGKIANRITSLPPVQNEIYLIDHLIGLPDSSILLQYGGGDCDACCYSEVLERWNKDGTLAWQRIEMDAPGPAIFSHTADRRLFAQRGYDVVELDWETGDTLWQYQYTSEALTGILFIPGSANFIIYGNDKFFRYDLDTTSALKYYLKASLTYNNYLYDFKMSKDGILYGLGLRKLVRFNSGLTSFNEFIIDYHIQDYTPTSSGVIMLYRPPGAPFEFFDKDTLGDETKIFTNSDNELTAQYLTSNSNGLAVTGQYMAGSGNSNGARSTQGWFRYFPKDSLNQQHQLFSASLTNINQRSPVQVDSAFYVLPEFMRYFYNFSGGDFEMEVTNTGDQPIDSFWINTRFQNAWFIWFCGLDMCKNVLYHHHLNPGESVWVDFGDIYAINQYYLPGQFCFWTSGPNARPDDLPEDDTKCVDRIVGIKDPPKTLFTIYPQPAADELIISNLPELQGPNTLIIYSLDGIARKTEILGNEPNHRISVADLPGGFYAIQIGDKTLPLVIAHR